MKNRLLSVTVSIALLLSIFCTSASAASSSENVISPRYTGLTTFTAGLTISSGEAWCRATSTLSNASYTQTLTMRLQRSVNQSVWTTVQSWTDTGGYTATVDGTRSITHGYYYRLYCTANVYTSSGSWYGSNTKITDSQYY